MANVKVTKRTIKILTEAEAETYDVTIGRGLLEQAGIFVGRGLANTPHRAAVISNKTVFALYGEQLLASLGDAGIGAAVHLIGDGERFKNIRTLEKTLDFLSANGIVRTDAVIALGGGVIGDLAGLAASLHLRGVPFYNIPTSLLAMLDATIGGKTGVNSRYGKNLIGTIRQPAGVLIDVRVLETLPIRHIRSGMYEAVKHGALSGRKLLKQNLRIIDSLVKTPGPPHVGQDPAEIEQFIADNVAFKASVVSADASESANNTGPRSRKILNFGHTLAHAIEMAAGYKGILHGEAVGYGILFAAELSKKLANLPDEDVKLLNDVVHRVGALPPLAGIEFKDVIRAFAYDKKNIRGSLQMVLLRGIGKPVIVGIGPNERRLFESTLNRSFRKTLR